MTKEFKEMLTKTTIVMLLLAVVSLGAILVEAKRDIKERDSQIQLLYNQVDELEEELEDCDCDDDDDFDDEDDSLFDYCD